MNMNDTQNATISLADLFGEPISTYTRAQAIADGSLIDVSERAKEAGFRFPVALTAAAWAECVAWSASDTARQTYQDEEGRLWDILWMASQAAKRASGDRLAFQLYVVPRGGKSVKPRLTKLKMLCGPGDEAEPVITIGLPHED